MEIIIKPYRLKHITTGLYYQPHRKGNSQLSERGKVYLTNNHGLSSFIKMKNKYKDDPEYQIFYLQISLESPIKYQFPNLCWHFRKDYFLLSTKAEDWMKEPVETNK